MEMHKIAGLSIMEWKTKDPMLKNLINMDEVFWMNQITVPNKKTQSSMLNRLKRLRTDWIDSQII